MVREEYDPKLLDLWGWQILDKDPNDYPWEISVDSALSPHEQYKYIVRSVVSPLIGLHRKHQINVLTVAGFGSIIHTPRFATDIDLLVITDPISGFFDLDDGKSMCLTDREYFWYSILDGFGNTDTSIRHYNWRLTGDIITSQHIVDLTLVDQRTLLYFMSKGMNENQRLYQHMVNLSQEDGRPIYGLTRTWNKFQLILQIPQLRLFGDGLIWNDAQLFPLVDLLN